MWGQGSLSFIWILNDPVLFTAFLVPVRFSCVRKLTLENNILTICPGDKCLIYLFFFPLSPINMEVCSYLTALLSPVPTLITLLLQVNCSLLRGNSISTLYYFQRKRKSSDSRCLSKGYFLMNCSDNCA